MSKPAIKPQGSYISHFSNLVKQHGGINLAQGIPGFQPPKELLDALRSVISDDVHQYAPGIGNHNLIDAIHKQYASSYAVERDNFLVVQGATEALSLIYTYFNKILGDDVCTLSFEPAYESYSQLPSIFGKRFISYPLNQDFSFSVDEFRNTITSKGVKVIFLSSPGNPYGKVWSKEEVGILIDLANELNFYLVFDAVYNGLHFDNPSYIPLDEISPNVFYVNSFSKMLCITGWRIGYLYAHQQHRVGLRAIHDYIGLCAPSVQQVALASYLATYNYGNDFVANFREKVKANFNNLSATLSKLGFYIPPTNGGCFIWAKLPKGITDGFQFASELYNKAGVAIIPGEHFSKNHTGWVRLNIARPAHEIKQAEERITQFLSTK
ncbi:MAG TPA: pyridoxal phosphate-dependent aminotransferase [Perlabentimonas sp.]|nr:pyridoxal phosphate-dependent aminotransferase [Perlabentimonas sp.]